MPRINLICNAWVLGFSDLDQFEDELVVVADKDVLISLTDIKETMAVKYPNKPYTVCNSKGSVILSVDGFGKEVKVPSELLDTYKLIVQDLLGMGGGVRI